MTLTGRGQDVSCSTSASGMQDICRLRMIGVQSRVHGDDRPKDGRQSPSSDVPAQAGVHDNRDGVVPRRGTRGGIHLLRPGNPETDVAMPVRRKISQLATTG